MASRRDPGTPIGGERDFEHLREVRQRLLSPQNRDFNIASPATPPGATPVTMEAIEGLLKNQLQPMVHTIEDLSRQMTDLNISVDTRLRNMHDAAEERLSS